MPNYDTASEIMNDVLFRAGEKQDGTSDYATAVLDMLNRAYQGIWSGGAELEPDTQEVWWWLSTYNTLNLDPALATGSISITNNATLFTLTGAPTYSLQGWYFKANAHADVFRISSHNANEATGFLESKYTGLTNTAANFKIWKQDYSLATDVLYLTSPMFIYQDDQHEVRGISYEEMRKKWPMNQRAAGVPQNFCMIGDRQVQFSHYGGATSGDLIKVDYYYAKQPADLTQSSVPAVPKQYRKILVDWTLAFLYEAKNDERAQSSTVMASRGITAMARENRRRQSYQSGDRMSQIVPRLRELEHLKGPLRTENGHIIGW